MRLDRQDSHFGSERADAQLPVMVFGLCPGTEARNTHTHTHTVSQRIDHGLADQTPLLIHEPEC